MNKKFSLIGGLVIIIIIIVMLILIFGTEKGAEDRVVKGDYTIKQGQVEVLVGGQRLVVEGNFTLKGELECENGDLTVIVKGDANIEGGLKCELAEELAEDEIGLGISLVVAGDLNFSENAKVETNGHVQLVEEEDLLITYQKGIDEWRDEIIGDTGDGNRIGPFIRKNGEVGMVPTENLEKVAKDFSLIKEVKAQAGRTATVSGQMWVNQPPKKVKQIVLFRFPKATTVNIQDFKLIGPDGRDGDSDEGNSCNAKGKDGSDAMRFYAYAPNMKINNFEILLGHGGNGGNAETKKDCDPGKAVGGEGGKSGNLKMIATQGFDIEGDFIIHSGWAGDGGSATAYGKDGGPAEDGGDAVAIGGDAEDNEKAIRAKGTINGTSFIKIGSMYGGNGGDATAIGGKGGDGPACKSKDGGKGGDATVEPGDGGDAKVVLSGTGAGRTDPFEDVAGDSGERDAQPGNGGNGSQCTPKNAGGNGGAGGNAILKDGKAGKGGTRDGQVGKTINQKGGAAGNGGDGCMPGKGGKGGTGTPDGADGVDGKNICPVEVKKEVKVKVGDDIELKEDEKEDPEPEPEPEPTGECASGEVECDQCYNECPPEQCHHNSATGCYFCE